MIPLKTIKELIVKHSNLEKELSTGNLDKKLFAEKSKEYSDINGGTLGYLLSKNILWKFKFLKNLLEKEEG